jgi:hypothetical protein
MLLSEKSPDHARLRSRWTEPKRSQDSSHTPMSHTSTPEAKNRGTAVSNLGQAHPSQPAFTLPSNAYATRHISLREPVRFPRTRTVLR